VKQVTPLENGLTRVLDLGSKLWALYDSESGVFYDGFYFAELLEEILDQQKPIVEQACLEGFQ
jgi:hypothetical protein